MELGQLISKKKEFKHGEAVLTLNGKEIVRVDIADISYSYRTDEGLSLTRPLSERAVRMSQTLTGSRGR